jgi:hypothetical protein
MVSPSLNIEFSISVWSYHFYILIENSQVRKSTRNSAVAKWLKLPSKRGASELRPNQEKTVFASAVSFLEIAEDSPVFREQVSKARAHLSGAKKNS